MLEWPRSPHTWFGFSFRRHCNAIQRANAYAHTDPLRLLCTARAESADLRSDWHCIQDPPQAQLPLTEPAVSTQLWRFRVVPRTEVVQLTERLGVSPKIRVRNL